MVSLGADKLHQSSNLFVFTQQKLLQNDCCKAIISKMGDTWLLFIVQSKLVDVVFWDVAVLGYCFDGILLRHATVKVVV